jgi:predicted PurR-regulated permease PerM
MKMSDLKHGDDLAFQRRMMGSFIQIAALVILISYCVIIVGPFMGLVIWGAVLAVAIYPVHLKISSWLGGRQKLAATLFIIIGLAVVLVPGWLMIKSTITSVMAFAGEVRSGGVEVPPPSDNVQDWPLVGQQIYAVWAGAAENLTATLKQFQSELRVASEWLLRNAVSSTLGLLAIAVSVIIAGIAMLYAKDGYTLSKSVASKITPDHGEQLTDLSIATIRSVTNGVLGVAVIQTLLAGLGFFVMGVPHGGLLALLVLITSIIQVPALVIIVPIIVWVFSFAEPVPATIFAVWSMIAALSDNVLKPILLGRGVDLPAFVVLIGAIGGMIAFGIIGLFLGAVILGLGYQILTVWLTAPVSEEQ